VNVAGGTHYVGITGVSSNKVNLEVTSTPQTAVVGLGETEKFDVNGDGYYDIKVLLNSIANNKASLTISSIHELIPVAAQPEVQQPAITNTTQASATNTKISKIQNIWFIVILVVILIVAAVIYFVYQKKR